MDIVTAVGGSILSVCFQGLLHRLNSIDFMKYIGQGQVLTQLKKWEKMLKRIHAVLEDAEEKQTANRLVEIWLSDLRDLAYDLEDIIDELATEVQRHNLEDKSVRTNNKVQNCFSIMCNGVNQKDELRLAEYTRRRVSHVTERPPSTSLVNEAKVYGREEDKKAMLKLLNAETNDAEVSVIPIIGMGGLGKTTLAQLVYNDAILEFDLKAWVSVGEDFDVFRVTKTVLLQLGDSGDDEDLDSLQVKLKQKLLKQKFLVVLDDVWTENYEQWTVFRSPFEAATPQSRIIVTTRSLEVSLMMGTTPAYPLKELSYDECFNVFAQHALGATSFKEHLELKEMGEEIVKRCGGLPLAAKALGGILRGKPNPNVWKELLSSEIWELPNNKSNILPALRLSYLHLPPHLKQCFAYCAIFPKNYELLWNEKLMDILSLSYTNEQYFTPRYCLSSNVMHDLVPKLKCLRVLSLTHYEIVELPDSIGALKHLRYLDLSRTKIKRLPESVDKLLNLQTLKLRDCFELIELPRGICNLLNLRHLDIIGTLELQDMPPHIGNLTSLCTLTKFVVGTINGRITELKKLNLQGQLHITSLKNVLDIEDADFANLKDKPGITELNLDWVDDDEFSSGFVNSSDEEQVELTNCCQIKLLPPLGQLKSLKKLSIEGLSGVKEVGVEFYNDDSCFSCLETLEISHMYQWELWSWSNCLCEDSVAKFPKLRELRIVYCPKLVGKLPSFLPSLEKVDICDCQLLVDLPKVLPSLLTLSISRCQESVLRSVCNATSLTTLKIEGVSGLVRLDEALTKTLGSCGSLVSFPAGGLPHNLIRLIIGRCGSLESLPEGNVGHCNYISEMSHLEELYIYECKSLRSSLNGKCPDSLKTLNIRNWTTQSLNSLYYGLSHLTILQIWNCPQLESFPGMELHIPTLISLQICDCERLRSLSSHMQNLQCLQYLQISTCHQLELFPKMGLPNPMLVSFQIYGCKNLRSLPNHMQHLTSLRSLKVSYCRGMESLTEGCLPPNLSELSIYECLNLKQPMPEWGLHRLASFRKLTIHDSGSTRDMVSFPDDDGLLLPTSLTDLRISKFKNLKSISRGIQKLISLQELDIQLCQELHSIPDEGFPATLEELSVSCCPLLQDRCLKDRGGDYWPIISHIPRIRIN
ncbi:hypothetical protein P3X46_024403 [Hevea brasiliensis]|uniref:Uncharacterized protein n=1 Tax=Hevea brasiliensis TaxID=3981 RepID=A0ABQ9L2D3_HEVBR|nr:hypothetical protein P3X46_024403 [Hevea brasiliensis]